MSKRQPDPSAAAARLKKLSRLRPTLALVLGSGFHHALSELKMEAEISYHRLPGFPPTGVSGHAGKLSIGHLGGTPVLVLSGRAHYYEGHPMTQVTVPDVSGQTQAYATAAVTGAGLTVTVSEESSDSVPAGQVIRQEPAAGTQVATGAQVTLTVSTGPKDTGCGCAGCAGGKGAFTPDKIKKAFGDLFLAGLSLTALLAVSSRKP